ncbi:MAG: Glycine--tRNA ligase alpha subunit [Candidatus Aerophobetes bacterium ADurb.Bin490]|nr:MAG: Glycine--tRNA ligase alpha subunit [Candidatus Aerophobetes bacterium ADurb.Bin490]HNZ28706.1 glycine--tRNA ligase subunit alpha [Candidatus Goldiibacteriota bacterium]HPI03198.1 glycine--tRNA ligase subunit alpha [Candidatus Goldiibacteriota bacterium]HPN65585.1 glycine--tRNA ligase subunit alpha [Candidatus Goldiibacteriota bacterium]HRQ44924.1 glycine--tRNA ligase subunit alpha [Candidatus Goldiibacteriota bacterium]
MYFQDLIFTLQKFWTDKGCIVVQPYDMEKGAATFNPATFFRCLGDKPWNAAFIEPCRRPKDGRYGENPNRFQHYYQYQVIMKPAPENIQRMYLDSLEAIGIKIKDHDIKFNEDDWESPTLGASGLGWQVWLDGMEITQYTYFQQMAGIQLNPITAELTYGLERIAMYIQGVDSAFDIKWNEKVTYGDVFLENEKQYSAYNFEHANIDMLLDVLEKYYKEGEELVKKSLPIPAYDYVLKISHAFNLLDARKAISIAERPSYIKKIRDLAKLCAEEYIKKREK